MPESASTESPAADAPVRSVLLPLHGDEVLLPSAMLAEVLTWGGVRELEGGPPWVMGTVAWRGYQLPVVSFERAAGRRLDEAAQASRKLAVVYALAARPELRCYAVACSRVPRPVVASPLSVRASAGTAEVERAFVARAVRLDGDPAFVPDFDALEAELLGGVGTWLPWSAGSAASAGGADA